MKILIEGYSYAREVVENVLPEKRLLLTDEKVTIENVGYFRNPACDDFVFFLPKVLLEQVEIDGVKKDRVFAVKDDPKLSVGFAPEEIIDPESVMSDGRKLSDEQKEFLYEFAVWIYRAIAQFKDQNKHTSAVWEQKAKESSAYKRRYETSTLLDVILALRRFHRDNQDYFLFKIKEKHSGANKINWTRTIAKEQAIIQNGRPIYLETRCKKRMVDFDEELLVIFYSILNYIKKFGFSSQINFGYELISGEKFERYIDGYGVQRLKAIKYKYFSDRDLMLWQLCFAFFDKAHKTDVAASGEEYLLAKNFEIVFESMIDDLIGGDEVSELRKLSDGKEIDHLYVDESLTRRSVGGKNTFYIADSKYYKRGNSLGKESIAKQFTYARNILQFDLDLFLNGDDASAGVKGRRKGLAKINLLRDEVTEGYDIIPNFFISATVPEQLDYDDDQLMLHGGDNSEHRNIHFENRLFDRDTLILSHYDVNFLYVVKLYAQNDSALKTKWRKKVKDEFRSHIRKLLGERFSFYAMMPYDELSDDDATRFLRENFRSVLGKVYSPYAKVNGKSVYSLALENPDKLVNDGSLSEVGFENRKKRLKLENDGVENLLKSTFYIIPCKLGEDPSVELQKVASAHPMPGAKSADVSDSVVVATGYASGYPAAIKSSGCCPWHAEACKDPLSVQMFVFPHTNQADVFLVRQEEGVTGPLSAEEVKSEIPKFKEIPLDHKKYYIWRVTQQKTSEKSE